MSLKDQLRVMVVDDTSVSRYHAEIRITERGWRVRDLGSTNGTCLNGVRLGTGQWPMRARDVIQFGEVTLVVETLQEENGDSTPSPAMEPMLVQATARASWEEALQGVIFDSNCCPRPGEQLVPSDLADEEEPRAEREREAGRPEERAAVVSSSGHAPVSYARPPRMQPAVTR